MPDTFPAQSGAPTEYALANFNATGNNGNISLWLITPHLSFSQPTSLSFYTRTIAGSTFPDRMEVRLSTVDSTNVGTTDTSVGDFTTVLAEVNPSLTQGGYPEEWTQFNISIPAQGSGSGRLAFRYFVTDGGFFGANSNYIGVDTFVFAPVPEPGCLLLVGAVGLAGVARRRLRRA